MPRAHAAAGYRPTIKYCGQLNVPRLAWTLHVCRQTCCSLTVQLIGLVHLLQDLLLDFAVRLLVKSFDLDAGRAGWDYGKVLFEGILGASSLIYGALHLFKLRLQRRCVCHHLFLVAEDVIWVLLRKDVETLAIVMRELSCVEHALVPEHFASLRLRVHWGSQRCFAEESVLQQLIVRVFVLLSLWTQQDCLRVRRVGSCVQIRSGPF